MLGYNGVEIFLLSTSLSLITCYNTEANEETQFE
jgi:hypothetical protein